MPIEIRSYNTLSESETFELGRKISKMLKPGDVISLEGDLGTGKTALTKGIAAGLGIKEPVTSPSFTLVNTYEGEIVFHHFDVYRIDDPDELFAIGWEEYFSDESVTVVEWGDRVLDILPPKAIRISLNRGDSSPDSRIITVKKGDENGHNCC